MSFNPAFNPVNNPVISPTIGGGNQALSPYMPNINGEMAGLGIGGGGLGYGAGLGYGGGAMLSPYTYGGYGGYMPGVGDLGSYSSYIDPWDYYDPDYIDTAYALGYMSAPQYRQYILMLGDRPRRRGIWPFCRGRDRYRFMIDPGFGYGGFGRRGWMSGMGIPTY